LKKEACNKKAKYKHAGYDGKSMIQKTLRVFNNCDKTCKTALDPTNVNAPKIVKKKSRHMDFYSSAIKRQHILKGLRSIIG
jgi:hypothetical protein